MARGRGVRLQHERAPKRLHGFPVAGLDAVSPEAAGEGAEAAPADTAAGTMHDVYDDHLSDYSPSLAQAEELDGVMPPNAAAADDDDPSGFRCARSGSSTSNRL